MYCVFCCVMMIWMSVMKCILLSLLRCRVLLKSLLLEVVSSCCWCRCVLIWVGMLRLFWCMIKCLVVLMVRSLVVVFFWWFLIIVLRFRRVVVVLVRCLLRRVLLDVLLLIFCWFCRRMVGVMLWLRLICVRVVLCICFLFCSFWWMVVMMMRWVFFWYCLVSCVIIMFWIMCVVIVFVVWCFLIWLMLWWSVICFFMVWNRWVFFCILLEWFLSLVSLVWFVLLNCLRRLKRCIVRVLSFLLV